MKIIVVGAGKVGYSLCERLVQDDHDVYLIDRSEGVSIILKIHWMLV